MSKIQSKMSPISLQAEINSCTLATNVTDLVPASVPALPDNSQSVPESLTLRLGSPCMGPSMLMRPQINIWN